MAPSEREISKVRHVDYGWILGIKFNARWFFCTECLQDLCVNCRGFHDFHVSHLTRMTTVNMLKDKNKARMAQDPDCDFCLGPASSGAECTDCQLCLCSSCMRVDGRVKAWVIDHAPKEKPHRSLILRSYPFAKFKLRTRDPCRCRERDDVMRHCGCCAEREFGPSLAL